MLSRSISLDKVTLKSPSCLKSAREAQCVLTGPWENGNTS